MYLFLPLPQIPLLVRLSINVLINWLSPSCRSLIHYSPTDPNASSPQLHHLPPIWLATIFHVLHRREVVFVLLRCRHPRLIARRGNSEPEICIVWYSIGSGQKSGQGGSR